MIAHVKTAHRASIRRNARRIGMFDRLFGFLSLRKSRAHLGTLDQHLLDDIGLTEAEARTEAERPIWDVPSNWRL